MKKGTKKKTPFSDVITKYRKFLEKQDRAPLLIDILNDSITPVEIDNPDKQRHFDGCGWYYRSTNRIHEAILVYEALYNHMLAHQQMTSSRIHKGMPLVWLADCHASLNRRVIPKQFLMLAACEDAVRNKGTLDPESTGAYFRLVWHFGLPHTQLERYVKHAWSLHQQDQERSRFPEWILQELDSEWLTEYPSIQETAVYRVARPYVSHLSEKLGGGDGRELERLAHYLVASMPGCRAYRRLRSHSTDYDVAGVFEGPVQDFRSDIGRYFVCECKDWSSPADFTAFAKFCRVLDSTKARFGILFSKNDISGRSKLTDAELEQLKVFHDRGIVIVVVSNADITRIVSGENLIAMLRSKYEAVRLDLTGQSQ